jgi:hypothetical protein
MIGVLSTGVLTGAAEHAARVNAKVAMVAMAISFFIMGMSLSFAVDYKGISAIESTVVLGELSSGYGIMQMVYRSIYMLE